MSSFFLSSGYQSFQLLIIAHYWSKTPRKGEKGMMGRERVITVAKFLLLALTSLCFPISVSARYTILKCLSLHPPSPIVYTPNTTSYTSVLQSTFNNLRFNSSATLKPILIISPLHESHVQASVICCKKHGLNMRVRSGGHDYEGLSYVSSYEPFVILDLANYKSIDVSLDDKTAWVQAGATMGELSYAIAEKSDTLGFPGGWNITVGVGGLFSGGGIGTMMRKYGMAADNIIDAQIVDSKGMVLDRMSMGEDLFWAIRGGGAASFCVVLSWKIRLVTIPPTVTVFSIKKTLDQGGTELVNRWQYVAPKLDENLFIRIKMVPITSKGGNRIVLVAFDSLFLGIEEELLPLMEKTFPELGLMPADCVEMSWIQSVLFFAGFPYKTAREVLINRALSVHKSFKVKSDIVRKPISEIGLEGLWRLLVEEEETFWIIYMEPFGGKMEEISSSDIPFPHRNGSLYITQYIQILKEGNNIEWVNRVYKYMTPYVSKSPRATYLNFRDLDLGENEGAYTSYSKAAVWGMKYFGNNFRRLAMVKSTVDEENFFKNEQSIPPLSLGEPIDVFEREHHAIMDPWLDQFPLKIPSDKLPVSAC